MRAEAYRDEEMYREADPNLISIKRNPYLVDYEQQRRLREHREPQNTQEMRRVSRRAPQEEHEMRKSPQRMAQGEREMRRTSQRMSWGEQETRRAPRGMAQGEQELRRAPRRMPQGEQEMRRTSLRMSQGEGEHELRRAPRGMAQGEQEMRRAPRRIAQGEQETRRAPRRMAQGEQETRRVPRRLTQEEQELRRVPQGMIQGEREIRRAPQRAPRQGQEMNRRAAIEKRRAAAHRRRIVRMQRMVLFSGIFCIAMLCGILYLKRMDAKAEGSGNQVSQSKVTDGILPTASSSGLIQGFPATEFAKHPEWEEKFLTPNEYSRPGEALEEVNSIFVHYTANPNTSAAQNRSYFEQLKDTHITSASAHFIIGYNGEIIQCIPLDEIAYAVQTRNYDSISIECCYKSADGSFTQETYDSLIELLAWLTDIYDLTTDDILRHYDCGGKKCPIYYTEHEDAWERLKKDVGEML